MSSDPPPQGERWSAQRFRENYERKKKKRRDRHRMLKKKKQPLRSTPPIVHQNKHFRQEQRLGESLRGSEIPLDVDDAARGLVELQTQQQKNTKGGQEVKEVDVTATCDQGKEKNETTAPNIKKGQMLPNLAALPSAPQITCTHRVSDLVAFWEKCKTQKISSSTDLRIEGHDKKGPVRLIIIKDFTKEANNDVRKDIMKFLGRGFNLLQYDSSKLKGDGGVIAFRVEAKKKTVAVMLIKPSVVAAEPMLVCWLLVGEEMREVGLGSFLLKFACVVQKQKHNNTHLTRAAKPSEEAFKWYQNRKFVQVSSWQEKQYIEQIGRDNNYWHPQGENRCVPMLYNND